MCRSPGRPTVRTPMTRVPERNTSQTPDCGRLTALSIVVKTMFHYEFCHLRHRAGEHWPEDRLQPGGARILQGLRGGYCGCHLNSMSNTQHCISTMPAASWKCLPAVDGDSQSQGGPGPELKQEDHEIQDAYLQLFTKLDVSVKEMKQYVTQIDRLPSTITETTSGGSCDPRLAEEASPPPLISEDSETDGTDHGGMKKVCVKLSEEDREDSGHDTMRYRDSYLWGSVWMVRGTAEVPTQMSRLRGHFPGGGGMGCCY
ncbi:phosphatidylinositol 3,4,5-trisphosphate-dependent Rac exchanger 1 protein [Camelus dromedarius]|uniref:phosphatidylinositol 3,4,5-trisphosphate-dependent Rac exchanger 1 protein n=1 Tax=Camelus dromedarius TaxID=9838 RepID=UPI00311924B9